MTLWRQEDLDAIYRVNNALFALRQRIDRQSPLWSVVDEAWRVLDQKTSRVVIPVKDGGGR